MSVNVNVNLIEDFRDYIAETLNFCMEIFLALSTFFINIHIYIY